VHDERHNFLDLVFSRECEKKLSEILLVDQFGSCLNLETPRSTAEALLVHASLGAIPQLYAMIFMKLKCQNGDDTVL
jgi:hypothetical protein